MEEATNPVMTPLMTPPPGKFFFHNAEEIVTIYGALSTYLKILAQQPEEDLETITRVTQLLIRIKPQAVEASREIAKAAANGQ